MSSINILLSQLTLIMKHTHDFVDIVVECPIVNGWDANKYSSKRSYIDFSVLSVKECEQYIEHMNECLMDYEMSYVHLMNNEERQLFKELYTFYHCHSGCCYDRLIQRVYYYLYKYNTLQEVISYFNSKEDLIKDKSVIKTMNSYKELINTTQSQ